MVEGGRTLLYALPDAKPATLAGLAALMNIGEARGEEAPTKRSFSLLAQVDLAHPLFTAFADARFNDFTKIHFWRHRRLVPESLPAGVRIIAAFDDESPALIEVPIGRGTLLILTSGWAPGDSQLSLSTKFVPLLYSALERSRPPAASSDSLSVGDRIPSQAWGTNTTRTLRRPDGTEVDVAATPSALETDQPGLYLAVQSGVRLAVNLPPEESRTAPLPPDALEKLGVPLLHAVSEKEAGRAEERKRMLAAAELENRQKLWRWVLVAGFLFVLGETWLAGRLTQPRPAPATS